MADDSKLVPSVAKRKPPAAGMGRKKGSVNKLTKTVKAAIEAAFDKVGGADYLARQAEENPQAFMTLLGKILPAQVDANITSIGMKEIVIGKAPDAR